MISTAIISYNRTSITIIKLGWYILWLYIICYFAMGFLAVILGVPMTSDYIYTMSVIVFYANSINNIFFKSNESSIRNQTNENFNIRETINIICKYFSLILSFLLILNLVNNSILPYINDFKELISFMEIVMIGFISAKTDIKNSFNKIKNFLNLNYIFD